jgi:ankyrin repeat protein
MPIIRCVVSKASRLDATTPEAISKFEPVGNFWLDRDARVDARDVEGQTALNLAVATAWCGEPMLPVAEMLLQRGADVNMQTGTGTSALLNCVAQNEVSIGVDSV